VKIVRLTEGDDDVVMSMSHLFDGPAVVEHTRLFLSDERHHLLIAREGDAVAGFVSGVEMTHPDKGTEMFLYELAVDEPWQRQGVGASLVTALGDLARARGCYGMWVLTEEDNAAALATYTSAGGSRSAQVMLDWDWSPP
jgi:ribosomal protein S18 acetylase RimI-like enzyme